jgi:S1-C subfamily serine protease
MKRFFLFLFLGCCSALGGALGVALLPRLTASAEAQVGQSGSAPTGAAERPAGRADGNGLAAPISDVLRLSDRFEAVARKVSPAVVSVEATKPARPNTSARDKKRPVEESGSGVIIKLQGRRGYLVLTNNHVIDQARPSQITISLADGRLLQPGRIWADAESDVALLSIDNEDSLPAAVLGDSDTARVGQWVLAIGSPFGLNQSVTHGIISARERGEVSLGSTIRIKDFLQTDAAINPGSSGGPLVNLEGQVIGINTAIASHSGNNSGVAFSIPVNLVKRVMKQLMETGGVARGYLGLQLASAFEPADARKLGLDRVRGAWVEAVFPNTPAAAAGLKVNDVVLRADQVVIRNENHLINLISTLSPGQRVRLEVWRERKIVTLEAVVGDWAKGRSRLVTGG